MEWQSEVEARIEAIRARQRGEGQDLAPKDARALAGEWYQWFLARNQGRPGGAERWDLAFEMLADEILDLLPDEMRGQPKYDLEALLKHEDVRNAVRPLIEGWAQTSQFLASKGIALTADARGLFLDHVAGDYHAALWLLSRQACPSSDKLRQMAA